MKLIGQLLKGILSFLVHQEYAVHASLVEVERTDAILAAQFVSDGLAYVLKLRLLDLHGGIDVVIAICVFEVPWLQRLVGDDAHLHGAADSSFAVDVSVADGGLDELGVDGRFEGLDALLEVVAEAWVDIDSRYLAGRFWVTLRKKLFLVLNVRLSYFFSLWKFINRLRFTIAVVVEPCRDVIVI